MYYFHKERVFVRHLQYVATFPSTLAAALAGRLLYGTAREQIQWFVRQSLLAHRLRFLRLRQPGYSHALLALTSPRAIPERPTLRLASDSGERRNPDNASSAGLRARKRRARPCRSGRDAAAPAPHSAQRANSAARDGRTSPRSAADALPVCPASLPAVSAVKPPPRLRVCAHGPLQRLPPTDAYRTHGSPSCRRLSRPAEAPLRPRMPAAPMPGSAAQRSAPRDAAFHGRPAAQRGLPPAHVMQKGFVRTFCRAPARTGRTYNESWTSCPSRTSNADAAGPPGAREGREPMSGQAASPGGCTTRTPQRGAARRPPKSRRMRGSCTRR